MGDEVGLEYEKWWRRRELNRGPTSLGISYGTVRIYTGASLIDLSDRFFGGRDSGGITTADSPALRRADAARRGAIDGLGLISAHGDLERGRSVSGRRIAGRPAVCRCGRVAFGPS